MTDDDTPIARLERRRAARIKVEERRAAKLKEREDLRRAAIFARKDRA